MKINLTITEDEHKLLVKWVAECAVQSAGGTACNNSELYEYNILK
jgi:hypothetical protein